MNPLTVTWAPVYTQIGDGKIFNRGYNVALIITYLMQMEKFKDYYVDWL